MITKRTAIVSLAGAAIISFWAFKKKGARGMKLAMWAVGSALAIGATEIIVVQKILKK